MTDGLGDLKRAGHVANGAVDWRRTSIEIVRAAAGANPTPDDEKSQGVGNEP